MTEPALAYVIARVRGRQRTFPDVQGWRALEATGDADALLEAARSGPLRPWVAGLDRTATATGYERRLRERWLEHAEEVTGWLPRRWQAAAHWFGHLPRLPVLVHLLRDGAAPAWTLEDPVLSPVALGGDAEGRRAALAQTALAPLATSEVDEIGRDWAAIWRTHWAEPDHLEPAQRALTAARGAADPASATRTLRGALRRAGTSPAAAFLHLGLAAVHLQRLRGLLASRALRGPA
ncbi:hypothetical protein SAMN05660831_00301 [Thiohalospira halophila DSM 15071]|uniref:Uncharacterized protein n=1 Tax=Thiohalospira halophila DSM 15071 TaxID=1123397 RepID=A0A1I1NS58_9GAMM|nr:hypothetical protein [Thiohalospira halophila]SFC97603.1 hypothetical protein SAMN05660831_00301 [Thiohalospira halophila DSM 15071]